ncbi:E3 ubiquitin-protein like [Actinidia chinensis var. chinensis]|uniref:U-box domain-containing protein n=1 Tax=Actinidia chinensis var. chinensis TaxID=1590841 RepID=A0A2R6PF88_ACTCC|nr:E3 ubiquitin-protein like [Actinidia chinensis var. chinensis]
MEEIEVPSHFVCPISMQLMTDPVTVSTGITYDRDSIEKWLFSCKNNTCPVTKQELSDVDLTPNHTLRRLIQAWCTLNASSGIERIPTPKPQLDTTQIRKLIKDANKSPQMHQNCLQSLRSIAHGSERSKRCLEAAGAVEFLASIIKKNDSTVIEVALQDGVELKRASDEALLILYHLDTSQTGLKKLINYDGEFLESLMHFLRFGNFQSRGQAIMLMKTLFEVADPIQLINLRPQLFNEVVQILSNKVSEKASKATLKLLVEVCPWGKNRIKAVEAGLVSVLVELLIDSMERRACELILVVLDQLCGCAEGRAKMVSHGAGLAVVSKKILRVSQLATDRAVKILSSVCRLSANSRVIQEMLQVGVVTKLCLVMQLNASGKTKERTKEILKLHSRVWKNSPCIPPHLLTSYPS